MATANICSDFGAPQNKVSQCFHCFPIYLPWSDGRDVMILVFWMVSFKPTFSLSSFTFIKRLFSSSLLSAIRVVSSLYWGYWYFSFTLDLLAVQGTLWCFWTVVFEKTLESPLDFKEIKRDSFPLLLNIKENMRN